MKSSKSAEAHGASGNGSEVHASPSPLWINNTETQFRLESSTKHLIPILFSLEIYLDAYSEHCIRAIHWENQS